MRRLTIALSLLLLAACTEFSDSQREIEANATGDVAPWTGLTANDGDQEFHFVNLWEPAFVVSVGDLIEGYTDDQTQLDKEWDEFEGFTARLEAPFFYVAGNHDMSNAVMAETWRDRFGPSFYHFLYKDVLFLVLNSELFGMVGEPTIPVPGPWKQAEQLAFVDRVLQEHPNPRWTIVLIHQPLWDSDDVRDDWREVEEKLGERDYTVFAGHYHRYTKHVRNDRKFITLATTGGGSRLRGPDYGEFDHVAWVTMTQEGPRIANLMLDGIHDENILTGEARDLVFALTFGAVTSVPVVNSGEVFETGHVAFQIKNTGSAAVTVTPQVDPGPDMRYVGGVEQMTLSPGASETVTVELAAREPIHYHAIAPGRITWRMSTSAGERALQLESTSALLPVAPILLPSGEAPTVDGDLSDWDKLPFLVERQGDISSPALESSDISYRFAVREAGGDVYFGIAVTDDSVEASEEEAPYYQDHVRIRVDARPDPERSQNDHISVAYETGYLQQLASDYMTLVDVADDPKIEFLREARDAVEWQGSRTASGYNIEAKISGAFLDVQHNGRWETLRVELMVADFDQDESGHAELYWQPYRFGDAPVAASGTFVRSSGSE